LDRRKKQPAGSTEQVHIEGINEYACYVKLSDIHRKEVFYDKLTYIYLELPRFTKKESELISNFDKWMYVLKNLAELQNRPKALQERIFRKLFRVAEIEQLPPEEKKEYERSLMQYRDMNNVINSAVEEKEESMQEIINEKDETIKEALKEKDDAIKEKDAIKEVLKEKDEAIKEKDEAIKEKDFHLVKNLSNTGFAPEKISEITGIDINRIHEIIKNI
jgi:DNA repair ATPase RecN